MFTIEGLVPWFIFLSRRLRIAAFSILVAFQIVLMFTGNYAFFNFLTIALCFVLLDDQSLRRWIPDFFTEPLGILPSKRMEAFKSKGLWAVTGIILYLTLISFTGGLGIRWPTWVETPAMLVAGLRSFNSYGLFAVMTPTRPEIILEGSIDGKTWLPYEFKYKPGDPYHRPRQVAPFQPRLDWQMWFAALGDYRQNPWLINLCARILEGSKPALALLAENPFPNRPPVYIRALVYEYRFSNKTERLQTGAWWVRSLKGFYCPMMSLKRPT